jgi:16S rRNA (guanine1207-N2)-methyltransferase
MDRFQAARLADILTTRSRSATIETRPDLWDLANPPGLQTLIYPVPYGGERALKLDMVEQAYHVLAPHGVLIVLSPYDKDDLFPPALKRCLAGCILRWRGTTKCFGASATPTARADAMR